MAKPTMTLADYSAVAREISSLFGFCATSYAKGQEPPRETIESIMSTTRTFFAMVDMMHTGQDPFERFQHALEKILPVSSLPDEIANHEDLAAQLIIALSGEGGVTLVTKEWFDDHFIDCKRVPTTH